MRNSINIFFALILNVGLYGQALVPIPAQLNFPNTNELQTSDKSLSLFNPNSYPIVVEEVDRFWFYGNKVFTVSDSSFTVMPGDTFALNVSFSPEHNLLHKQALIFKTSSGFGHTAVEVQGQGLFSKSYYNVTRNQTQESLKTALSNRIALNYNSLGYTTARDNMYASIDNNGGQVECAYTGRTASFTTRAGANTNNFNCEHTFPQGFFNKNEPMRSDIHHLFPTDVTANSKRGNDPFGWVTNASWQQGGSQSGGGKFEPRDTQKGATARAMMYFVLRYQDYSNHFAPQENVLRIWHSQHPPSSAEKNRNDDIYALQNNRNPFVDYPQFIERISDLVGLAQDVDTYAFYYSDDTIKLAQGNSGLRRFNFVIYNLGNMAGAVSNFSLSDPGLSFYQGNPGALSLNEGEQQEIIIEFDPQQSYNATLSFEAFGNTKIIPIQSGPTLRVEEVEPSDLVHFYPNPNAGLLRVQNHAEIKDLHLSNLSGQVFQLEPKSELDLQAFKAGFYVLSYQLKNGLQGQQKLLLQF